MLRISIKAKTQDDTSSTKSFDKLIPASDYTLEQAKTFAQKYLAMTVLTPKTVTLYKYESADIDE